MKKLFYSFIIFLSVMFLYKTSSFADERYTIEFWGFHGQQGLYSQVSYGSFSGTGDNRYALLLRELSGSELNNKNYYYQAQLYSNSHDVITLNYNSYGYEYSPLGSYPTVLKPQFDTFGSTTYFDYYSTVEDGIYRSTSPPDYFAFKDFDHINTNIPIFTDLNLLKSYLRTGDTPFISDLELDSFDVWSYGVRDSIDNYSIPEYTNIYEVKWSDSRISTVKVRIDSVLQTQDFVSQSSPHKNYFRAGDYADVNGDVITLTATPYTSDGHYGMSMYYSFTYDGNNLVTNILRKFIKNKHYDNTIEIPFNGTDNTYDVDGVTTNNVYKVYYNPTTNEYNDFYLYEVTYAPIIVYPYETPAEEITDTQTVVNNNYVTNNYYETTQNINVAFDFNFDDVTTQEVQDTYDEIGGFFDGFGVVVGRLVDLLTALFPFLSPAVAAFILAGFALIVTLGIIALVIKIASIIADFIPL